ncbi:MAG: hypothetical protein IJO14_07115 [Clostridia bacterium]|nr:hypothetical protein [Clostridia bacterium]
MKSYKIDKARNIGNVIFVVEGGRKDGGTELRLLKKIFSDILEYEVRELRRGCEEFIGYGSNPYSRVFALNLPKNQLTQLTDDSLDALFRRLKLEFNIKPEDCPVFFLYDRDFLSYKPNELRGGYVKKYTDPYGDEKGNQGQLLLSYPAVESYLLSCIQDDVHLQSYFLGRDIKPELAKLDFNAEHVNTQEHLLHAVTEMDKGLHSFGLDTYDPDHLAPVLLGAYDAQQNKYKTDGAFSLLSLISMALLELGIITECDEN